MIEIGLIRHGCTVWNKAGRSQGCTDIPLDAEGMEQARRVAERLAAESWDVIYTSDLQRAKQTGEIIQKKLGRVPLFTDERLRERSGGKTEGTTLDERIATWGENWREREAELEMESVDRMVARGQAFLADICQKHASRRVLIVSHGAFLKRMLLTLVPDEQVDVSLGNCSVTKLEKESDWKLTLHNCSMHVAPK